jgi:hypothetical protein
VRELLAASSLLAVGLAGCCSHGANQYAFAPPLAPPVYPQPQLPAAPMAAPMGAPVGAPVAAPAMPAAPVVSGAAFDGVIPANADGTCPPCATGGAIPVAYESADQTIPCPPGP